MAASPQRRDPSQASRRRASRYSVKAPLDVTMLRSGIPDTVPGRSVNVGEGGLAAMVAGELVPGESVAAEIRLPQSENPLRTRALVRHQDKLRYGMEFVGLSAQQQTAIRKWSETSKAQPEGGMRSPSSLPASGDFESAGSSGGSGGTPPFSSLLSGRGWIFLLASLAILVAVVWWHWYRGWQDLESMLPRDKPAVQAEVHVPSDAMAKLVRHRVDPEYPAAARHARLQAVIVLDVIVARDGSVADVHPLNGPDVLAQSAVDAMRWWRFEPYKVDGKPAVVETTVAVEFKP
jgi:TonB family protein